jgi:hypothetical protein
MQHYTPLNQLKQGRYQLCFYEDLRARGAEAVRRIAERWNLSLPAGLDQSLARPSAKASGQAGLVRGQHSAGWMDRLDPAVVQRIMGVVDEFGLDLYKAEA